MALYRGFKTESRWNKKLISLSSPDWSASLRPSFERKTRPDALIGPSDNGNWLKMWWAWMFQYFAVFNYEWLPLLLLNQLWQLHGQLRRPTDCYVPSHTWLSSLPGDQKKTIRPFPIRSAKTKWLFGAWNASRDQSPELSYKQSRPILLLLLQFILNSLISIGGQFNEL